MNLRAWWNLKRYDPDFWQRLSRIWMWTVLTVLALCAAMFLLERSRLSYQRMPMLVSTQTQKVKAGQSISYTVERCSSANKLTFYTITRKLVSQTNRSKPPIYLTSSDVELPEGCTVITNTLVLPTILEPDIYVLEGEAIVLGFFRPHVHHWSTAEFEVTL